jgi:hypothetical protein
MGTGGIAPTIPIFGIRIERWALPPSTLIPGKEASVLFGKEEAGWVSESVNAFLCRESILCS